MLLDGHEQGETVPTTPAGPAASLPPPAAEVLLSEGRPASASVRGNLGPPTVVTSEQASSLLPQWPIRANRGFPHILRQSALASVSATASARNRIPFPADPRARIRGRTRARRHTHESTHMHYTCSLAPAIQRLPSFLLPSLRPLSNHSSCILNSHATDSNLEHPTFSAELFFSLITLCS